LNTIKWGYFISASMLLFFAFAIALGLAHYARRQTSKTKFLIVLLGAISTHALYWFFFSNMWARYLWPVVALSVFAMCIPILVFRPILIVAFVAAFFALFATPSVLERVIRAQLEDTDGRYRAEQRRVLEIISDYPELPVVSQWWGAFYDIVYMLPPDRKWFWTDDETRVPTLTAIVVNNERWAAKSKANDAVRRQCKNAMPNGSEYFTVFICQGAGSSESETY
jgi:hypothetical protein